MVDFAFQHFEVEKIKYLVITRVVGINNQSSTQIADIVSNKQEKFVQWYFVQDYGQSSTSTEVDFAFQHLGEGDKINSTVRTGVVGIDLQPLPKIFETVTST